MNILYIQESSQILSEEELLNLLGGAVDGDTITDPSANTSKCNKCDKCDKCSICF